MKRISRFDMIANQMMKGCSGKLYKPEQIVQFKELYKDTINYIEDTIPKPVSTGVCGALGKAVLWYGREQMAPFIEAIGKRRYNGPLDPCHVLWEWLIRNTKRNTNEIYRRTVTAIRLFLRNAQNPALRPAKDDIFEWSNDYRTMTQPSRNQWGTSTKNTKQTEAAFLMEIDEVIGHA